MVTPTSRTNISLFTPSIAAWLSKKALSFIEPTTLHSRKVSWIFWNSSKFLECLEFEKIKKRREIEESLLKFLEVSRFYRKVSKALKLPLSVTNTQHKADIVRYDRKLMVTKTWVATRRFVLNSQLKTLKEWNVTARPWYENIKSKNLDHPTLGRFSTNIKI